MPPPLPVCHLAMPVLADFLYLAHNMREDEREHWCALRAALAYDPERAALGFATAPGPTWTLLHADGLPLFAGGFEPVRPGVYAAWAIGTSAAWVDHWRRITAACNRVIRRLLADDAHRIEITTLASRAAAHEWYCRGLRMQPEGQRRGYFADGQDGASFAITRGRA